MGIIRYSLTYLITVSATCISAYADIVVTPPNGQIALPPINEVSDSGAAIGAIITWAIGLSAVLTILAITWGGIQMVLAVGEEEKMKKARHTMIYAFIGLIISGIAYGIVKFITNLNLDSFL